MTQIHKKGKRKEPKKYRPLYMLSCIRKIIESSIAEKISKELKIYERQFGFQRGLSLTVKIIDVETIVRKGRNRITTLDLSKAYDKVNRTTIL